jgi:hypothetical protein
MLLVLGGVSDCDPQPVGELVAHLEVTATLLANGCGEQAVPLDEVRRFDAEVRRDGGVAYWQRSGTPMVQGTVSTSGVFTFVTQTQAVLIEPEPAWGYPGCMVDEVQTTEMRIHTEPATGDDAGVPDASTDAGATVQASMEGSHLIRITPVLGSDCVPVLLVAGGTFDALPCSITYDVVGTGTAPAP